MPAANFYGKRKTTEQNSGKPVKKRPRGKPFVKGQSGNPAGKPKGTLNRSTIAGKEFWTNAMHDPEYQEILLGRLRRGELAPAMETLGWHYADGKPTEHVEIVHSQARLDEIAARDPEKFTALAEQVRAAFAVLAEVEKP